MSTMKVYDSSVRQIPSWCNRVIGDSQANGAVSAGDEIFCYF